MRLIFLLSSVFLGLVGCDLPASNFQGKYGDSPYPQSLVLKGITWEKETHRHAAPGSDNWPTTWANDGYLYTAWGDGGGFGGTNMDGRVSLGVARIDGAWNSYKPLNIWGGNNALYPAQFTGKSYGLLAVDNVIYMALFSQEGVKPYKVGQIAYSKDRGATFKVGVTFDEPDAAFAVTTFLNFGQNYRESRDNYVYLYAGQPINNCIDRCIGNNYYLARVHKKKILNRNQYKFFAGLDKASVPAGQKESNNAPRFFRILTVLQPVLA